MKLRLPILQIAALALACAATAESETRFLEPARSSIVSEDGSVALAWERAARASARFELRRWPAESPGVGDGVAVYEGMDTATFVSGLPAGEHVFKIRVREPGGEFGEWSESAARVDVVYPGSGQVLALMLAGAATLTVAVGSIAIGHRRARAE